MTRTCFIAFLFPVLLSAQGEGLFPEDRLIELRDEIVFGEPEREESTAKPTAQFTDFDLSALRWPAILSIGVALLVGLGFLLYLIIRGIGSGTGTAGGQDLVGLRSEEIAEEKMMEHGVAPDLLPRAEAAGQFDVAVRLVYLSALQQLNAAQLIRYRKDLSNRDYGDQLKDQPIRPDFIASTRAYERYWYGQYPIDRLTYRAVKTQFLRLTEQIPNVAPITTRG